MLEVNQIICGDCLEVMKDWPDESINCCITSPPYWALRDYGVEGQLGLEPTFEEYIDKLCAIYDEVKRVLRPDGTCFVNLGDTYWGGKGQSGSGGKEYQQLRSESGVSFSSPEAHIGGRGKTKPQDGKHELVNAKSLCLIPQRFAIEMVNRGWILRNIIIWHKPNPMPSSAKDRFTVDFEYVYFFVKNKKYWFEPQYEPFLTESNAERPRMGQGNQTKYKQKRSGSGTGFGYSRAFSPNDQRDNPKERMNKGDNPLGRNKRTVWTIPNDGGLYIEDEKIIAEFTEWLKAHYPQQHTVWTIPTQAYPEAHFATFPEKLVEPMIKAGCPEFVCTKCGKAREKIWDTNSPNDKSQWPTGWGGRGFKGEKHTGAHTHEITERSVIGYTDCGCGADWRPGVVLDMFGGACTTAVVAYRNRRDYVIVELKPEYCEMGKNRLKKEKEKFGLLENSSCIVPEPVAELEETNLFKEQVQ